jgi:hypothetical protein
MVIPTVNRSVFFVAPNRFNPVRTVNRLAEHNWQRDVHPPLVRSFAENWALSGGSIDHKLLASPECRTI